MRRFAVRYSKPGSVPGSLVERAVEGPGVTLEVIRYSPDTFDRFTIESLDGLVDAEPGIVTWLNIAAPDATTLHKLTSQFGIHPLVAEDVINLGQRPKVESYDGYLFVVLDLVTWDEKNLHLEKEQVSLLLLEGLVISIQERPGDVFDPVRERIASAKGRIRRVGADYLLYALVDAAVDHLFPVMERLGDRIEEIEDELVEDPSRSHLAALHTIKLDLLALRRSTWPLREMTTRLSRADETSFSPSTAPYLRDVADHAVQVIDILESYRDVVMGLMDLYLSSVSNRMNEVMKVLTVIATIFIPLSFIAGVYGMNFNPGASPYNMPELGWRYGYPFALAIMAAVAIGMLIYFSRKKWL